MALTAVSFGVINAGAVLTETALEGEFSNIYNNGEDLGWPATKAKDLDGQKLVLDTDGDTVLFSDTDDQVAIGLNSGTKVVVIEATAATAKNGFKMALALSGQSPYLMPYAGGGDTVLDMSLRSLGSGKVVLADEDGNEIIEATVPASASVVNHIRVVAASAGAGPSIAAVGDDATINLGIGAKGTGLLSLGTGAPVEIGSLGKTITIGGLTWPTADGSNGASITTNGAGGLTFAAGQAVNLIAVATANNDASISFTLGSSFSTHFFVLDGVMPQTAFQGNFQAHLSNDGGSTFKTSSGSYSTWSVALSTALFSNPSTAGSVIQINPTNFDSLEQSANGMGLNGIIEVFNFDKAGTRTGVKGDVAVHDSGSGAANPPTPVLSSAYSITAEVDNAIRFRWSNGNIISGNIRQYGRKKST